MATPTVANTPSASYLVANTTGVNNTSFGGSTHTSSSGSDRCLVAVLTGLSNLGTIRTASTLTWNGTGMTKAAEQGHDDSGGNAQSISIWTLNDPASGTAGAIAATFSGNIEHAQIWFYNVEGCPSGAANAFATDVDDATGDTAVSISISPTVANTLCIMGVTNLSSGNTFSFTSPINIDDQRITATEALGSGIGHGTLSSSGAQNVQATISATNEFSAVAICLEGAASSIFQTHFYHRLIGRLGGEGGSV